MNEKIKDLIALYEKMLSKYDAKENPNEAITCGKRYILKMVINDLRDTLEEV
jgi:hypothetical protein